MTTALGTNEKFTSPVLYATHTSPSSDVEENSVRPTCLQSYFSKRKYLGPIFNKGDIQNKILMSVQSEGHREAL